MKGRHSDSKLQLPFANVHSRHILSFDNQRMGEQRQKDTNVRQYLEETVYRLYIVGKHYVFFTSLYSLDVLCSK